MYELVLEKINNFRSGDECHRNTGACIIVNVQTNVIQQLIRVSTTPIVSTQLEVLLVVVRLVSSAMSKPRVMMSVSS